MTDRTLLKLSDVTKRYAPVEEAAAPDVLRGVSLSIVAGESLAITGPSGSGKSTLLNIMGTLDAPTSGRVVLDGQDLAGMDETQQARLRNEQIGFVFQLHHLLPQCTAYENVLIPTLVRGHRVRGEDADVRARRLLERVGLDTRLRHRPGELSGGEQLRVAVVRAMINEPRLLLADEPTGSLDAGSAKRLADLLVELNREEAITLIVVTHSVVVAERMQRRFEMRDGLLTAAGTST